MNSISKVTALKNKGPRLLGTAAGPAVVRKQSDSPKILRGGLARPSVGDNSTETFCPSLGLLQPKFD
jgi:hypothetical protein